MFFYLEKKRLNLLVVGLLLAFRGLEQEGGGLDQLVDQITILLLYFISLSFLFYIHIYENLL